MTHFPSWSLPNKAASWAWCFVSIIMTRAPFLPIDYPSLLLRIRLQVPRIMKFHPGSSLFPTEADFFPPEYATIMNRRSGS